MSYLEDTIDWQAIQYIDAWLDNGVGPLYQEQPLAQDWARISKIAEELGEAIQAFIGVTGQNPRKGIDHIQEEVMNELADTAITAILAMQHFEKDTYRVRDLLRAKINKIENRARNAKSNTA
jgi:NTP pyrophosphatase (non-canonical NTP hydrolase)